jgi:hypothetical protein
MEQLISACQDATREEEDASLSSGVHTCWCFSPFIYAPFVSLVLQVLYAQQQCIASLQSKVEEIKVMMSYLLFSMFRWSKQLPLLTLLLLALTNGHAVPSPASTTATTSPHAATPALQIQNPHAGMQRVVMYVLSYIMSAIQVHLHPLLSFSL